jgi:hypothetical protein
MPAQSKPVQELTPFGHALAGALGGVFSNAVVYPLDTVKTRIQASTTSAKGKERDTNLSVSAVLLKILKEEGISGYYKGFGASMLNTFSMQYAYFFFYSFVRSSYMRRVTSKLEKGSKPPILSTATELILGAIAGALAQIFTIPVSVIATRQQLSVSRPLSDAEVAAGAKQKDDSFLAVGRDIIREDGITGLWSGLKPGLVLTINPAITYGMFERIKSLVNSTPNTKMGPWKAFVVGALSKTLATVVTYPYIMAKVRIQAKSAPKENGDIEKAEGSRMKQKQAGALSILAHVLRTEGFLGWYQGMGAQITKAVLSQALLFMSKDQFEVYALFLMNFVNTLKIGA